ncbi:unnamed protein product, partial [Litomosoides sigmodontis]
MFLFLLVALELIIVCIPIQYPISVIPISDIPDLERAEERAEAGE